MLDLIVILDEVLLRQDQNQNQQQSLHISNQNTSGTKLFKPDGSFSKQLQRQLHSIFTNRDDHINFSRSLNRFYTHPTSHGHGFENNLDNNRQLDFSNLILNNNQHSRFYHLNGSNISHMGNNSSNIIMNNFQ